MKTITTVLVCFVAVFAFCSIPLLSVGQAAAVDCSQCHQALIDSGTGMRYVHAPFLEGNCATCHIVGEQIEAAVDKSPHVAEQEQLEKIDWFRDAHGVSDEHWIQIPENKVSGMLFYKAWDGRIRSSLESVVLPVLNSLPAKKSDLQAPIINNIRVADVRRGISTTVTIRWETDEFTDSEVLYGAAGLNSSAFDGKLSRQHELILVGLDADKSYQYQIVARDLFGNRSESQFLTFVTDKTFIEAEGRHDGDRFAGQDIMVDTQLFRHQSNYLLVFKADRPVSLSLGVETSQVDLPGPATADAEAAVAGTGHPLLKSRLDTNIDVCYNCHSSFQGAYSHPVNVFPQAGMVIPAEYPLLPDGRISCMSCHADHGSNIEFRLIKERKSDLCRGCHRDY